MPLYTYSFKDKKRDLSDILSTVIKDEPRFISNFKRVDDATATKHEWHEDQLVARSVTATAVEGMVVTASEKDVAKIYVDTTLVMKDDSALFRVVAKTLTTFTVALLAANGSATTAPVAGKVMNVVNTPQKEGTSNGDGEENYRNTDNNKNHTMIIRKDIIITGTALAIGVHGNLDNDMNRQTEFALRDLARDLNRTALFGHPMELSATQKGSAGGLYYFGLLAGGLSVNANGHTLDSFIVNDGAQAVLGEGGRPTQILCGVGQARVLSNEYKGQLQIVRSDEKRGAYVALIVNEINGSIMHIMADPDMPDGEIWVNDIDGFGLANLRGRAFTDEDATPPGFDGIKRWAIGELTFEFKNAGQRLCRIYGLKPSALALAAIRG